MRGATRLLSPRPVVFKISIHAPHARSDGGSLAPASIIFIFQSTLLMRGATAPYTSRPLMASEFQSTLLMRGATADSWPETCSRRISIHAPHARSDRPPQYGVHRGHPISIHAPHARSDKEAAQSSTSSIQDFNPRSSCEERRTKRRAICTTAWPFQSTLLMRGATAFGTHPHELPHISIHAPHARSDHRKRSMLAQPL